MRESARVLKKGARFYGLETVRLPNYDGSPEHRDLVQRSATIMGACMPGPIGEWTDAFKANGFRILYEGHPTPIPSIKMLLDVNDVYAPMQGRMCGITKT